MAEPSEQVQPCPRCKVLERRVAELEGQLATRDARIAKLEARMAELERLLDQRTRDAKRQAAPFSKGGPKAKPKTPGRKPGKDYGTQAFRAIPDRPPDQIIPVEAPKRCPSCAGRVRETHVEQQFQIEIPAEPSCGASTCTWRSVGVVAGGFSPGTNFRPLTPWGPRPYSSAPTPRHLSRCSRTSWVCRMETSPS